MTISQRLPYEAPAVECLDLHHSASLLISLSVKGNVGEWQELEDEDLNPTY